MVISIYDAENLEFRFSRLRGHLNNWHWVGGSDLEYFIGLILVLILILFFCRVLSLKTYEDNAGETAYEGKYQS